MLATQQAQEILDNATVEANMVRAAATQYTDDILANLESIIVHGIDIANNHYGAFVNDLNNCFQVIKNNRMELQPEDDDESVLPDYTQAPFTPSDGRAEDDGLSADMLT